VEGEPEPLKLLDRVGLDDVVAAAGMENNTEINFLAVKILLLIMI
jgi:hypothetical protein